MGHCHQKAKRRELFMKSFVFIKAWRNNVLDLMRRMGEPV